MTELLGVLSLAEIEDAVLYERVAECCLFDHVATLDLTSYDAFLGVADPPESTPDVR